MQLDEEAHVHCRQANRESQKHAHTVDMHTIGHADLMTAANGGMTVSLQVNVTIPFKSYHYIHYTDCIIYYPFTFIFL